jgi:undecaprenyl phosphate N,N'-diacetylbacillosamine 1-phosphate transferase
MRMFYTQYAKFFFDKSIAFISIILLAPVFLLISIINYSIYKNIFFIQQRTGKGMKAFMLIKFQTMKSLNESLHTSQLDIDRITGFGKILRSTSLDELPQLFLVLKGEMSLIGPRPLPSIYDSYYSEEQRQRFKARPGMTGWAQVNGRNRTTWEERFKLDNFYIENISFIMDMRILVKTFLQLLKFNEVNTSDDLTMKPFKN